MARILVVDDEKSIRIVLREFLRKDGHEVQTAEDVPTAFRLLEEHNFDVVVTDIIMPGYTGVDLLKKIHGKWPDIQVIMITGEPNVDTAVEAVRSGAYDYLSKPVNRDAMRNVVSKAARVKALNDEKKRLEEENRKYSEHLEEMVEERTAELEKELAERKRVQQRLKGSLKEKEVLLREVHHRVKNNMQIIQSLFKLQVRNVDDEKIHRILRDAGNRIRSMSLIHEKLYRSKDLVKINFNEYIVNLARDLYQSYRTSTNQIRFRVDCGDISLDINIAIPCGLVINELITNSLKHAFPGDKSGEINIIFKSLDDDRFSLVFSDNGIGIPDEIDFKNTDSFGLHLVNILVEGQLMGEIELDRKYGTKFLIKFGGTV